MRTLPSLVNVMVVPDGGLSGLPPRIPVSPTHSPTIEGGSFFGASLAPGAATTKASPTTNEACIFRLRNGHRGRSLLLRLVRLHALEGDEHDALLRVAL